MKLAGSDSPRLSDGTAAQAATADVRVRVLLSATVWPLSICVLVSQDR